MAELLSFDADLIGRYDMSGPRYTSYPTALSFHTEVTRDNWQQAITTSGTDKLSLYVHIPFCHKLCYYCGCNKVITRHNHKADTYLDHLEQEILAQAPLFARHQVHQLHLGGGTPTFLTRSQMTRLMTMLRDNFRFVDDFEGAIEVDPRAVQLDDMAFLADIGFNRVSFGVQDFDKRVQEAVNRVQDEDHIRALVMASREAGFGSINLDLIYGLPFQNAEQFAVTLHKAVELDADRLSVFNYAHMPSRFPAQAKIKEDTLPTPAEKLDIFATTINVLTGAGYHFVGMDHFAKQDDELALAQKEGRLHRNFQGYTTDGDCDLLGLGVSAISQVNGFYAQNEKVLKDYQARTESDGHALTKGYQMSEDDQIRATAIRRLLCNLWLEWDRLDADFGIDSRAYFEEEIGLLDAMERDGLLSREAKGIRIHQRGRLLVRSIAMTFDAHLKQNIKRHRFSRII
ncbi:oxygen-independent coproporphyrinogen III oxidase [Gallaecimonas sp. GXIMD4217]|uniref:oxygen-independent coproporphyrinogen III oxidase n=1 Tax=Gallaecimonas sp. GXIMD4217 TaxID=3131927 RepID=UPI00311ABB78